MSDVCDKCGKELQIGDWPFCNGGHGKPAWSVIGDDWPGGKTFENMGHEPVTCYSKTEWKAEMKKRGLRHMDKHCPMPGSDRDPHTSKWV